MAGPKHKHSGKADKLDAKAKDAEHGKNEQGTVGDKRSKDSKKQKKQVTIAEDVQVHANKRAEEASDDLWGGDSEDEEVEEGKGLTINRSFAKHFEERSRRKELQQLQRDAPDEDESDSDDESEDENADALDPMLDAQIMRTVALIRKHDPSIYDTSKTFFEHTADPDESSSDGDDEEGGSRKSHKKQTYKDLVRQQLLEKGAELSDDEDQPQAKGDVVPLKTQSLAYDEEQRQLRKAFLSAGDSDGDQDGSDDDDLLQVREKTAAEIEEEQRALHSAINEIQALSSDLPRVEQEKDAFLTQYMLQQRWKDELDEVGPISAMPVPDEEDEEDLDKMDQFESQYNFRFEEEGGVEIQSYARNVQGSVRKVDESRKKQRESRKERKAKEKEQKMEELKRLKNLKREEIKKKLDELAGMSGGAVFDENDLEGDWDPDAFERRMQQTFDDSYYDQEDPNWQPDVENGEDYYPEENWEADDAYYQGLEDYGDGQGAEHEELDSRNKIQELVSEKDRLIDELYQLDHEDIVAGIPTRFKYSKVAADDYGLTTEEILFADDEDLNQYLSLKALAPYREHIVRPNPKKRKRLRQVLRDKLKEIEESQTQPQGDKEEEAVDAEEPAAEGAPIGSRRKRNRKRTRAPKDEDEAAIVPTARPISVDEPSFAPVSSSSSAPEAQAAAKPKDKQKKHQKPKLPSKKKSKDNRLASYGL